jgi:hypothetical protein
MVLFRQCRLTTGMLELFLPAHARRVVVYLNPINMRWSGDKLRSFCSDVLNIEPEPSTAFLFTNTRRDCLLVYSTGGSGDQTLMKKLDKGAFLLPTPDDEKKPFVIMKRSMLARLFRS